jgi:ferredoxin-NADP reductase
VRSFVLDLGGHPFVYSPGQWIDFYLAPEGQHPVAGYTLTSIPDGTGSISIAVKRSRKENPVTAYLHETVAVGDVVYIEGGHGSFVYHESMGGPLVLLAGGIGINPVLSIARYAHERSPETPVSVFYSATTPDELVFRRVLEEMASRSRNFRLHLTVTRDTGHEWDGPTGRIDTELLSFHAAVPGTLFFICGPLDMMRDIVSTLRRMGVGRDRIRYEQWW